MTTNELITTLGLTPFVLMVLVFITARYVEFITRGRLEISWLERFLRWSWSLHTEKLRASYWEEHGLRGQGDYKADREWIDNYNNGLGIFLLYSLLGWFGIVALCIGIRDGYLYEILLTTGVLVLLILPRYLGDIFHTLRYSFKSKDSERLKELEAKVKELSEK